MALQNNTVDAEQASGFTASFLLILIIIASFALRITGIGYGLPLRLQPDEWSQIEPAIAMFSGDYNPHIFYYPSFTVYFYFFCFKAASLLAPGYFKFTASNSSFWILARIISAFFGTATVLALFYLSRKLYGTRTAIVSALLLAFYPLHVQSSHYAIVDIPLTLWITAALIFMCISKENNNAGQSLLFAGIFGGLASSTKYTALPLFLILIFVFFTEESLNVTKEPGIRKRVRIFSVMSVITALFLLLLSFKPFNGYVKNFFEALLSDDGRIEKGDLGFLVLNQVTTTMRTAGLVLLLLPLLLRLLPVLYRYLNVNPFSGKLVYPLLAFTAVFFIVSPYVLLDFSSFLRDVKFSAKVTTLGYYENKVWTDMISGSPIAVFLKMLASGSGIALATMSLAGIILSLKRRFLPVFLWSAIYLVIISSWKLTMSRFLLPLVPFFILFASTSTVRAAEWISRISGGKMNAWLAVTAILIILCINPVQGTIDIEKRFLSQSTLTLAFNWIDKNIPAGSRLILLGDTPDMTLSDRKFDIVKKASMDDILKGKESISYSGADYVITGYYAYNKKDIENEIDLPPELKPLKSFPPSGAGMTGPEVFIYSYSRK